MTLDPIVIVLFAIAAALGFIILLIIRDTIRRKGRCGINLDQVNCPRCGEKAAKIRKPSSLSQGAWGGSSCSKCGCEFDKWGVEVKL